VGRATSIGPEDPSIEHTEVAERLVKADPESADGLRRANELLLDSLRTTLPFTLETMARELRAGGGPIVVASAIAAARGVDGEISDEVVAAAAACELPTLLPACYRELAPTTGSELARFNNTLALLSGEFISAGAGTAAADASPQLAGALAGISRRMVEGLASELDGAEAPSAQEYLAATSARQADLVSLAMRTAGVLAGDGDSAAALSRVGEHLGAAWQIGTELADVSTGDETARRPPGSEIRAGRITLPVIHGLAADEELAGMLEGKLDGKTTRELLTRLRASGAIEHAAEDCRRQVELALTAIDEAGLSRPEPLRAIARLCADRLPVAT
jgi:heptaprenyl diphosphate synthase